MISSKTMPKKSGSNGPEDSTHNNVIGREAMLQFMEQRAMRTSMEGSMRTSMDGPFSTGGMFQQSGFGQNLQGSLAQFNDTNAGMFNDGSDLLNERGIGLQGNFVQNMTQMPRNSNQAFLGSVSDMSHHGGMRTSFDGSVEDELLKLLIARRQSLQISSGSGLDQMPNQLFRGNEAFRGNESVASEGNIQSLTDELLRVYAQNKALIEQHTMNTSLQQSLAANGQMSHQHSFASGSNLHSSAIDSQDILRLTDTTGMMDHPDALERIEPVPLSMNDLAMRDHYKKRDRHFLGREGLKRQFESKQGLSVSYGTGQPIGFDFSAMGNQADYQGSPKPRKRRKSLRKKPVDMPRRPLSAYNLFFSEERERILTEISGEESAEAGAEPPSPIESDPNSEDEANEEGMKSPNSPFDEIKTSASGEDEVKIKALLRPIVLAQAKRRPHRKTHGKISFQALAQMVGKRWKGLPDDRRKYYQDLAQEDMKRQKAAMEEYYKNKEKVKAVRQEKEGDNENDKTSEERESTNEFKSSKEVESAKTKVVRKDKGGGKTSKEDEPTSESESSKEVESAKAKAVRKGKESDTTSEEDEPINEFESAKAVESAKAKEVMTDKEGDNEGDELTKELESSKELESAEEESADEEKSPIVEPLAWEEVLAMDDKFTMEVGEVMEEESPQATAAPLGEPTLKADDDSSTKAKKIVAV